MNIEFTNEERAYNSLKKAHDFLCSRQYHNAKIKSDLFYERIDINQTTKIKEVVDDSGHIIHVRIHEYEMTYIISKSRKVLQNKEFTVKKITGPDNETISDWKNMKDDLPLSFELCNICDQLLKIGFVGIKYVY